MTTASNGRSQRAASALRVVALNVEPAAYRLVADWAAAEGHDLVLLLTTPGPPPRTYHGYRQIVAAAPPEQDVFVTTRLKRAAPVVAATRPDLLVSYTFPYRLPDALLAVPRLGAVNLHPSPLPRYRGPNPARMVYEGEPTLGATLHRTAAGFDTGAILSRQEARLPDNPTVERVRAAWRRLLVAALTEGARRAAAGQPGEPQDDAQASYAASFSPEELRLAWDRPGDVLQRQATALNLLEPRARAALAGAERTVLAVVPGPLGHPTVPPGTVLAREDDRYTVAVAGGVVDVLTAPTSAESPAAATTDRAVPAAVLG